MIRYAIKEYNPELIAKIKEPDDEIKNIFTQLRDYQQDLKDLANDDNTEGFNQIYNRAFNPLLEQLQKFLDLKKDLMNQWYQGYIESLGSAKALYEEAKEILSALEPGDLEQINEIERPSQFKGYSIERISNNKPLYKYLEALEDPKLQMVLMILGSILLAVVRGFIFYKKQNSKYFNMLKQDIKVTINRMAPGSQEVDITKVIDIAVTLDDINTSHNKKPVKNYSKLHQGEVIHWALDPITSNKESLLNDSSLISKRTGPTSQDIELKSKDPAKKGQSITVKNFYNIELGHTSTAQLFWALIRYAGNVGKDCDTIRLPLEDYMALRGLKDIRSTRDQIKRDLDLISNITLTYKDSYGALNGRIITQWGIHNGLITVKFADNCLKYFMKLPLMDCDDDLFKVNTQRYKYAFNIGIRISQLKHMNAGKVNEDIVAVDKLMTYCKGLPTIEEIQKTNRQYERRIFNPFEQNIDHLQDIGIIKEWHYCNKKNQPLTDEQLENFDYSQRMSLNIKFIWPDTYPDQTERKTKIEERKQLMKTTKKRTRKTKN